MQDAGCVDCVKERESNFYLFPTAMKIIASPIPRAPVPQLNRHPTLNWLETVIDSKHLSVGERHLDQLLNVILNNSLGSGFELSNPLPQFGCVPSLADRRPAPLRGARAADSRQILDPSQEKQRR
jgi:hypothetical protein